MTRILILICMTFLLLTACNSNSDEDKIGDVCDPCPNDSDHNYELSMLLRKPVPEYSENSRYFVLADSGTGTQAKSVFLTGSHTWDSLVQVGDDEILLLATDDSIRNQEYNGWDGYLEFLEGYNHNFIRLWTWEPTLINGTYATDILPWDENAGIFDLEDFDEANNGYFDRLRDIVDAAKNKGIYVSIMLFEGYGMQYHNGTWTNHPFNPDNNINMLPQELGEFDIYTLKYSKVTDLQKMYIDKLMEYVNNYDNILYEIGNELVSDYKAPGTTAWQYELIRYIQSKDPHGHPVGMTFQNGKIWPHGNDYQTGKNTILYDTNNPADWISPGEIWSHVPPEPGSSEPYPTYYMGNPPLLGSEGKIVILDSDHTIGVCNSTEDNCDHLTSFQYIWRSFLRGYNPIWMDAYGGHSFERYVYDVPWKRQRDEMARLSMGMARTYANEMDLNMVSYDDGNKTLATTGYCMANPGANYVVFTENASSAFQIKNFTPGYYIYEWFNPRTYEIIEGVDQFSTGWFTAPSDSFSGKHSAVLYLKKLL